MNVNRDVTGITVCWNTKDLIERAYTSVRKFHPEMPIIIIDCSDKTNLCYSYTSSLADANTRVFHASKNIGHGRGLVHGISNTKTPFVLVFDSDIEMLKSPLQAMLDQFEDDTYGVGYTEKTAFDGHEYGCKPSHLNQGHMKYLHPYFCLIQLKEYKKYLPFCHHGAPAVNTMLDIHRRGLGDKVIKEFEGLGHSSGRGHVWEGKPREFIRHDTAGTRSHRRSLRLEEIEGVWDRTIPMGKITVITCSGDRPAAFKLCKKWVEQQTLLPDQWIVVDDGKVCITDLDVPFANYIYRQPKTTDPKHTLLLNLKEAFDIATGNIIIFMEDDEYYAPNYIKEIVSRIKDYEMIGIGRSRYYYLPKYKYFVHPNMGHASLAQTAFKKSLLPEAEKLLDGNSFLDIRLWRLFNGYGADCLRIDPALDNYVSKDKKGFIFDDSKDCLYVGMKGMIGRTGIGSGHSDNNQWYEKDLNKKMLKKWISRKEDFEIYANLNK